MSKIIICLLIILKMESWNHMLLAENLKPKKSPSTKSKRVYPISIYLPQGVVAVEDVQVALHNYKYIALLLGNG